MRKGLLGRRLAALGQLDLEDHHAGPAEAAHEVVQRTLFQRLLRLLGQGRVLGLGVVVGQRQAGGDHLLEQVDAVEHVERTALRADAGVHQVEAVEERTEDLALLVLALDVAVRDGQATLVQHEVVGGREARVHLDLAHVVVHRLQVLHHAAGAHLRDDLVRFFPADLARLHEAVECAGAGRDVDDEERIVVFQVDVAVGDAEVVEEVIFLADQEHGSLQANTHAKMTCPPSVLLI